MNKGIYLTVAGIGFVSLIAAIVWWQQTRHAAIAPVNIIASPSAELVPEINPPKGSSLPFPAKVTAQGVVVYDVASRHIIYGKNEHARLMPASTTKMMTALVALDEYDPEEIITVSRAAEAIGHSVDLVEGEQFTVINLVTAMLINSGNDAAVSLADHHSGGYQTFVDLMNRKAMAMGLKNTHFSNVSGVEADDHYSSAADLATIATHVMDNPTLKKIVGTKEMMVPTANSKTVHKLKNLNQLLWDVPGVVGIKTGWTELAGDCLVTYISRDHDIITVVLNSQDRFADSKAIIDWAYSNLAW